jgi:Fur family peroxide stress response transcriptional regulator
LYDNLKKDFPNLSMGNIYRNINILIEQKKVNKIHFGSTFDRFECEKCGSIIDLNDVEIDEEINKKVQNFKVSNHKIQFYGLCNKCL